MLMLCNVTVADAMMSMLPMVLCLSLSIATSRGNPQDSQGFSQDVPSTTKASSRLYDPNFGHEPYWPGGDWMLGVDMPTTLSTASPVLICGQDCAEHYRGLGPVCVMSMFWSHYEEDYQECTSNYAMNYFHTRWDGGEHMFGGKPWEKYRCGGKIPYENDYFQSYFTINSYCEYLSNQCLEIPEEHIGSGKPVVSLFFDISKAFHFVHLKKLLSKLYEYGIRGPKLWTVFVHLGQCMAVGFGEPDDSQYLGDSWKEVFQTHFDWGKHEKRADFWVNGVRERLGELKQTPFVPHRWPPTTPSEDAKEDDELPEHIPLGPPTAMYGPPVADTKNAKRPVGGPPGPSRKPGYVLRDGVSEQPSQVVQDWQEYLRILR